jgi:hypothetical protein
MSTDAHTQQEIAVACDPTAIAADQVDKHMALVKHLLFEAFEERQELADGIAWRFAAERFGDLCRYIDNESRCCPFLTFTLEVSPGRRALWLRLTGSAEAKAFLLSEMQSVEHE